MRIIETIEKPGITLGPNTRISEDALCHGLDFMALFDGATSASRNGPYVAEPGKTDAHWVASQAASIFYKFAFRAPEIVPKLLINELSIDFDGKASINPETMPPEECPSTTISCAIRQNGQIHFIQVGDSPILIKRKDHTVIEMAGDPVLLENDRNIHSEIRRLRNLYPNMSLGDVSTLRKDKVPSIRHMMNKRGGYGVLTVQTPESLPMQIQSIDERDIHSFIIMSDGLWEAFGVFKMADTLDTFYNRLSSRGGLETISKLLQRRQAIDCNGHIYPRNKVGDDIAAAHVRL